MDLKIRKLTDEDFNTLNEWWRDNRFPTPPKDALPENGTGGIMIHKNGVDICAGFIYFTNSKIMWIEYIVANFDYRETDRKHAINVLISELCGIGKRKGFKYAYTSLKNENLIKRFEEVGFTKAYSNTTEMVVTL